MGEGIKPLMTSIWQAIKMAGTSDSSSIIRCALVCQTCTGFTGFIELDGHCPCFSTLKYVTSRRKWSVVRGIAENECILWSASQWLPVWHDEDLFMWSVLRIIKLLKQAQSISLKKCMKNYQEGYCIGVFCCFPACFCSLHILVWKANSCAPRSSAGDPCVSFHYHQPVWRVCVSLFALKSTGLTWSSLEITNQRPSLHISPQVTFLGKQCSTYYFFLFRYRMAWPSFQHSTFIYKNLSSFIHRNSLVSVTLFYSPFCALVEKDFSFGERDT